MNPSNIFGGPQTAFQSTNNTSQTGNLFQSFAQQNPTQNVGFGQPSALTQPVFGLGQPSVFNQTPAFGQTGGLGQTQTPSFSSLGSAPAFGQPGIGQSSVGFRAPPPSYSQSTGQNQSQSSGFGKPSGFGLSQTNFNPPAINQSSFSQVSGPNRTSKSSTGGRSDNTPFVFKPSNESVFKPIFSVCSEPPSSMQSSAPEPFGLQKPGSGKMENASSGSLFSCIKPSTLGFNFSQPAAAPSSTFTNASLPPKEPFAGIQFTFSQPAKASSTSTSTSQPLTPSTFSFTPKVLEPQPDAKVSVFGGAGIKSFGFGASRAENAQQTEEKVDDVQTGKSESAFGGFSMKRKEEPGSPNADASGCAEVGGDGSRQPAKRPLLRSRGPAAGLFRNALTGIMRSKVSPVKRDDPCPDEPDQPGPLSSVPPVPAKPPDSVDLKTTEDISQKAGRESQSPAQRSSRKDSTESLGGLSPPDATAIQCKGVPPNLNNKDLVKQHFQRFGTVRQVFCRPQKNLAIVHFLDHASAAKAKKNGKVFQDTEIQIFWQRKKTSQGDKPTRRGVEVKDVIEEVDSGPASLLSSPNLKPSSRSGIINTTSSFTLSSSVQRTSIAKVLQFETEPAPEAISHAPPQQRVHVLPSVLQPLIGQVAETAEEKYRLLDQRDKLLRQGLPKRTGLDMSKVFVGTCPDMCPEKERYMRETRNQLSTFEVVPDTEKVDHFAAIKEYSRSSADQEEPLPHDLRPLPVLSMTMDYLVTQIIDQGEGNCRDWYDFVWNRTRGIRKDITQQHLCDPKTVMLIEKCTRFHIHCAHHLCQEPMMSFDAKINNENMTKCLQSLKEMYQDLATKEIYCPSEAEFRQYNVLLKLNDGDILREVQQFRKEVRESREVDFAVQAFAALNSNNYVRFFKLVNAASYLSGCILHRYFNQVRSKALKILNIAMTVGSQRATIFPIEDFVRILMFRNAAEAADFIQHFGLNISDGMVELSRTTYQEPDFSLPQKKSLAIEKKRSVLIGEVVNGGPLPNPPQHNPVCSFDSNNKYNGGLFSDPPSVDPNACPQRLDLKPLLEPDPKLQIKSRLLAEPQLFAEVPGIRDPVKPIGKEESGENSQTARSTLPLHLDFQPISIPQPVRPPSPPPKPEPTYTEQEIMEEADAMLHEVVTTEVSDVSQAAAQYVSVALSASDIEMETVVSEVLQELLSELYSSEIRAERERIAEEKRKLEEARKREAFLEQFSGELCAEISEDVLSQSIRETAEAEIRFALEEKEARIAQCTADVCDDLLEETLAKDVAEIAEEILKNELRLIHKFIKRWRDVVSVRRQLKRQMRGFPAASGCVDPQFKLKALVPSAPSRPSLDLLAQGMVNLGVSGNMSVSCTSLLKMRQEAVHQMKVTYYYNLLLNERLWSPLDLSTLVSANTPKAPEQIFWKATLLLPSDSDGDSSYDSGILADWLKVKLSGGCSPEESLKEAKGQIQSLCVSHSLKFIEGKTQEVYISVMASHGPLNEEDQYLLEEQNNLYGTNSLLMLLPPLVGALSPEEADVALLSALLQLRQVQQVGCWHSPIPLVVMVTGNLESKQDVEEALMLSKLVQDGFLSEYIFIHIPETLSDLQGSEQLTNVVGWLASRSPAGPPFSSHTLLQLVESGLCREFYSRLQRDKQERNLAALPSQPPEPIVQLCNSVLDFLADAVSVDGLSGLCWPPLEFSCPENALLVPHPAWNSPEHLDWLKRAILGRKLPEFDLPPSNASWPHVCASIFSYVSQIPTSPLTQPILMSRLDNLLRRVNCKYHYQGDVKDECDEPSFHDVPWDEVICLCLEHRMKDWALAPLVAEGAVLPDGEVLVYLVQDSLEGFQPPEIWEEAVKRTHQEIRASELLHSEIQILPKLHVIHSQLDFEELPVSEMQRIPMAERFEQILSSVRKIHSAEQRTSMQIQPACLSHNSPSSISNASRKRRSPSNGAKQEMETVVSAEKSQSPCKMQFAVGATHIPLVERLQQTLSAMRDMNAEGQRIGDQIQLRMDADALDSTSFPLFLTSSMLSSPPMVTTPRRKPLAAAVEQVKTDIPAQKTSLLQRLHDLKRELSSQQEDQLLSSLKLKCLVDIVEN